MTTTRALLCLALGMSLQASAPVHFGGAVQLDIPLGDLKSDLHGKLGIGGSFQVSFETGERTIVRPRLDLDHYLVSEHDHWNSDYREELAFNSGSLGADLIYSFSGNHQRGFYGLAGAGVLQWVQTYTTTDQHAHSTWSSTEDRKNRVSPWVAAGLGYQFNPRIGFECRMVGSRYDAPETGGIQLPSSDVPTTSRDALTTQMALTFRW